MVLARAGPAAACAKETILLRADGIGTLPLLEDPQVAAVG